MPLRCVFGERSSTIFGLLILLSCVINWDTVNLETSADIDSNGDHRSISETSANCHPGREHCENNGDEKLDAKEERETTTAESVQMLGTNRMTKKSEKLGIFANKQTMLNSKNAQILHKKKKKKHVKGLSHRTKSTDNKHFDNLPEENEEEEEIFVENDNGQLRPTGANLLSKSTSSELRTKQESNSATRQRKNLISNVVLERETSQPINVPVDVEEIGEGMPIPHSSTFDSEISTQNEGLTPTSKMLTTHVTNKVGDNVQIAPELTTKIPELTRRAREAEGRDDEVKKSTELLSEDVSGESPTQNVTAHSEDANYKRNIMKQSDETLNEKYNVTLIEQQIKTDSEDVKANSNVVVENETLDEHFETTSSENVVTEDFPEKSNTETIVTTATLIPDEERSEDPRKREKPNVFGNHQPKSIRTSDEDVVDSTTHTGDKLTTASMLKLSTESDQELNSEHNSEIEMESKGSIAKTSDVSAKSNLEKILEDSPSSFDSEKKSTESSEKELKLAESLGDRSKFVESSGEKSKSTESSGEKSKSTESSVDKSKGTGIESFGEKSKQDDYPKQQLKPTVNSEMTSANFGKYSESSKSSMESSVPATVGSEEKLPTTTVDSAVKSELLERSENKKQTSPTGLEKNSKPRAGSERISKAAMMSDEKSQSVPELKESMKLSAENSETASIGLTERTNSQEEPLKKSAVNNKDSTYRPVTAELSGDARSKVLSSVEIKTELNKKFKNSDTKEEKREIFELLNKYLQMLCESLDDKKSSNIIIMDNLALGSTLTAVGGKKDSNFELGRVKNISASDHKNVFRMGAHLTEHYNKWKCSDKNTECAGVCLGFVQVMPHEIIGIFRNKKYKVKQAYRSNVVKVTLHDPKSGGLLVVPTLKQPIEFRLTIFKDEVKGNQEILCCVWKDNRWNQSVCKTLELKADNIHCSCDILGYTGAFLVEKIIETTTTTTTSTTTTPPTTLTTTTTTTTKPPPTLAPKMQEKLANLDKSGKESYVNYKFYIAAEYNETVGNKRAQMESSFKIQIAKQLGLNQSQIRKVMVAPEIDDELDQLPTAGNFTKKTKSSLPFDDPGSIEVTVQVRVNAKDNVSAEVVHAILQKKISNNELVIKDSNNNKLTIPNDQDVSVEEVIDAEEGNVNLAIVLGIILAVLSFIIVILSVAVYKKTKKQREKILPFNQKLTPYLNPTYKSFHNENTLDGTIESLVRIRRRSNQFSHVGSIDEGEWKSLKGAGAMSRKSKQAKHQIQSVKSAQQETVLSNSRRSLSNSRTFSNKTINDELNSTAMPGFID